jgi:twinkle protein
MGVLIDRLPHNCGTKKGLSVFADDTGEVNGYCFACNTYVANPYGTPKTVKDLPEPKVKSQAEIDAEIAEIGGYQVLDLPSRKLRAKNLDKFGVRVSVSEVDGTTPQEMYMPYTKEGKLCAYKVKTIGLKENKTYWLGDGKDVDLFNWEQAKRSGAYRLIITEGEADSVAVDRIYEMYGKEEYHPAVVSLPYGAGRARQSLQKHAEEIKRLFREVIFCFDNDKAGQEAVAAAMLVLPEAKSVVLPEKDANDCLISGKAKAAYTALAYNAAKPKNTRILSGFELHDKAKQPAKYGELSWPFAQMNRDLRGVRLGETIYISAGVKCGKSTLKSSLIAHFIQNDGVKVFVAAPEEPAEQTYKLVAGQLAGKIFHDPEIEFDEDAFDRAGALLKDNLHILNLYQQLSWHNLKEDIVRAVELGCKVVMIDPITSLSNGLSPADANTMLQAFAQELAALAKDLNFVAILFAHLKAPEGQLSEDKRAGYYAKGKYLDLGNCSHEMGGSVYSNQLAGSRAMMRSAHLLLAILANKDPDLPEETRNTRQIQVLEDRNLGISAKYSVYYNKNTGRFIEV